MIILNLALLFILLASGSCAPKHKQKQKAKGHEVYAVIIDAGSSGSRVVGYKFDYQGSNLVLLEERFQKRHPGLSSYADKPKEGAKTIMELVNNITDFVPDGKKPETVLYLRATAGLRLLPERKRKKLLKTVQKEFKKTKYKVTEDAADMLRGVDEGLFAWFTLNFLKNTLDKPLAALEMGGASAQVTYKPKDKFVKKLKEDMHKSPYKEMEVFSKSYLGLGLQAARHAIFTKDFKKNITQDSKVSSRCFAPASKNVKFTFQTINYTISGKQSKHRRTKPNIVRCKKRIAELLLPLVNPKPLGVDKEKSVALSAFYYRGLKGNLITDNKYETTLGAIWDHTKKECCKRKPEDPFLCMDLLYMHTLLKDGYGLKDDNKVKMVSDVGKHELSWALGFAYSKLVNPK